MLDIVFNQIRKKYLVVKFFKVIMEINWLAQIVAAASSLAVGAVYYHPKVFGAKWMASANLTEEIFILVPMSVPARSTVISSGIFSPGHFNSTFLLTIFNTPPLFNPGESG